MLEEPFAQLLRCGSELGDDEAGELDGFGPADAFALQLMQPGPADTWLL